MEIEVWYRGQRWDGDKPEPVQIGVVSAPETIGPLVLTVGGGMCEARGEGLRLQGCYFDTASAPSKSCDALRDLLAILQDNDKWSPDPAGCLAQAVKAGIAAVRHDLKYGWPCTCEPPPYDSRDCKACR